MIEGGGTRRGNEDGGNDGGWELSPPIPVDCLPQPVLRLQDHLLSLH